MPSFLPRYQTRQTIVRLLSIMASAKEINQYLKRFSQVDAKRFAVVSLDDAVLQDDLEAIASSLSFLQDVGLTPVILMGAGRKLEEELSVIGGTAGGDAPRRTVSPDALARLRRTFQDLNLQLVEALQHNGARATSVMGGVFEADYIDRDALGLIGRVTSVNLAPIESSLQAGSIPVISSLAETAGGQILKIGSDCAINELVQVLQPFKIIFLTGAGGLLDATGRIIDSINLSTEYGQFARQSLSGSAIPFAIGQMKDMLERLPLESSIAITSPANLAKELFTHKGSGTLVRRGENVLRVTRWDDLDLVKLRALIESSFGRQLVDDYFERTSLLRAYVSDNYRAAVILSEENGIPYLDKFAVLDDAQGEGLGRAVWKVMRDETPKLFWRSRHNNQVNIFYYAQSDGCFKQEKWKVFWYGLETFGQIQACVDHCAARMPTLL
ncbi:acetylglutamate kinase [Rhizobium straminoryzae]|uniref:Acetylglutamate kinase n=1 Tax=Rhizobium straminoryzae TaxID=1387186 RepID=A0A549T5U5_9HYPH|nr:acetylglutamate kinase [Rhizobium straminoryzae]TRL37247.1 acetylglutamate kinase [Rhizobium straminoryzae]